MEDLGEGMERNVPWCIYDLGFAYLVGNLELERDEERGIELMKSAAAKGYRYACGSLGDYYYIWEDYRSAEEWWARDGSEVCDCWERGQCDHGLGKGHYSIAEMYYHGENVGGRNLEVALKWYESAAKSGSETKAKISHAKAAPIPLIVHFFR